MAATRKDVSEADKKAAVKEYGNVEYADEANKKYPLDTEEHVRAAASYWGMPKNKGKYSSEDQKKITAKIEAAKKKFKIGEDVKASEVNLTEQEVEKQILRIGKWNHRSAPNGVLEVTSDYIHKVIDNFKKISSPIPVYRGHREDIEAEGNPDLIVSKNISDLIAKDDGLYARMKIDPTELTKYNDVSASIQPNYEDHETGEVVGPVLRHIALVVNPYIKGLKPFIPLSDEKNYSILLSEINMEDEKPTPTEVETEVTPKEEAPIEVPTPEEPEVKAEPEEEQKPVDASETSESIRIKLADLEKKNAELMAKIQLTEATDSFNTLLRAGKILPTMKSEFIALSQNSGNMINLADGSKKSSKELLESLFSKLPVFVNLEEKGVKIEDGNGDTMNTALLADMKDRFFKRQPNATEEQWNKYVSDNKRIIEAESKKQKK